MAQDDADAEAAIEGPTIRRGRPQTGEEGWFLDEEDTRYLRFWDGQAWTRRMLNGPVPEHAPPPLSVRERQKIHKEEKKETRKARKRARREAKARYPLLGDPRHDSLGDGPSRHW